MKEIVIRYSAKTTSYFTADYGQLKEDWNKQDLLDNLGWRYQSKTFVFYDEMPSETLLDDVRKYVTELCSSASSYIYQVVLLEEGKAYKPITAPLSRNKNVKSGSDVIFINLKPPVPEWVPGEEEEEALLYRGAS